MSSKYTFYSITDYEWLEPTGDASRLLISYSIAEDIDGSINREDKYIIANLSLSAEVLAGLDHPSEKVVAIIGHIKNKLESALKNRAVLPVEIEIDSYDEDFPPDIDAIEFNMEDWNRIEIERGFGLG